MHMINARLQVFFRQQHTVTEYIPRHIAIPSGKLRFASTPISRKCLTDSSPHERLSPFSCGHSQHYRQKQMSPNQKPNFPYAICNVRECAVPLSAATTK